MVLTKGNAAPSFHDAELIAMSIDRNAAIALLTLRLENGQTHRIELRGVKAIRCEDFVLQNVVSRILWASRSDFSSQELDSWVTWVTSLSDAKSWLPEDRKRGWVNSLASGELEFLVLEPSAGAQLAALVEQVVYLS